MVSRAQHASDPADLGACRQRFPARSTPGRPSCAITASSGSIRLLQPAIKAAEEGYVVAPRIAFDWKNQFEKLKKGTNTERYLLPQRQACGGRRRDPSARTRQDAAGDRQGRPRRVLQGRRSPRTWWRPCAASAACTRWRISPPTPPRPRSPIGTMYKGHDVWQCPPNGPGITMLVMLNILSRFDLTKFPAMSVERFHLEAEAARIAYMMREQYIGDPAHVNVDVARILTKEFADEYGSKIRMDRMLDLPNVAPPMNPSTVYITVVDKRPQRLFLHQFDRAFLRFGDRLQQDRHPAAEPRRRLPHPARPSQLHRAGQAAAAHHHSEPRHQGRPRARCRSA